MKLNRCLVCGVAATLALQACRAPEVVDDPAESEHYLGELPTFRPMLVVPVPDLVDAAATGTPLSALVGKDTAVQDLLLALFKDSDINLLVDTEADGLVTFDVKNTTVERAFEALLRSLDLSYEWDGSFLHVRRLDRQVFDVDLLSAESAGQGFGQSGRVGTNTTAGANDAGDVWATLAQDLATMVGEEGSLIVNRSSGTVAIEARPSAIERVRDYLDHTVRRVTNQVSLEARILEVRLSDEFRLGVNWSLLPGFFNADETGTLPGGAIVAQTAASGGSAINFGLLNDGDFEIFVDALETQGQVRILSSPRVSTLNNVPAMIRVVDQIPVIDREIVDSLGGLRTQFDVRFEDAGVSLSVTPQVGVDGVVTAQITPEITEQTGVITTPDGLQTQPILSTRTTSTSVRVPDGRAVVIGGLRSTRKTENVTGLPLLASLPVLGALFRSTVQTWEEVELMIVLVPRIVDSAWMTEEVRRGADRLVALRRPFVPGSIHLEGKRFEDWRNGFLMGSPRGATEPGRRELETFGTRDAGITAEDRGSVTRRGLAALHVERARAALGEDQITHGLTLLARAIALDPSQVDPLITAGVLHARDHRWQDARRMLEQALAVRPQDPMVLSARGAIEVGAGAPRGAIRFLQAAHDAAATSLTACNLAAGLLAIGRHAEARALLATHGDSELPEVHANLAYAQLQTGATADAAASLQRALELGVDPRNPRITALRSMIERATPAATAHPATAERGAAPPQ